MKNLFYFILLFFIALNAGCSTQANDSNEPSQTNTPMQNITEQTVSDVVAALIEKYGDTNHDRIEKGVAQAAALWTVADGTQDDFKAFCLENFVNEAAEREIIFNKLSRNLEILWGNYNKISLDLRAPLDLDMGEITPVDLMFGGYDAEAHFKDDFFNNKVAFYTILNFPAYTLAEKTENGSQWTEKQWAYVRLGDVFTARVPAELKQKATEATTVADAYISEYNIYMGNLVNAENERLFPPDLKLISHWGLRDELKSHYNTENGIENQRMIYAVMQHIISQEIPQDVINSDEFLWNPLNNTLYKDDQSIDFKREPDTRYEHLLNNFKAYHAMDEYNPLYPNYIARKFESDMEIPQEEVEALFVEFVSSPLVKEVAALIKKRLNRDLEPFDIWYTGFKADNGLEESELDEIVAEKYPTVESFEQGIPEILEKLQFSEEKAAYIAERIAVDAARGAGHAWGAQMRGDKAHLRTRIGGDGMNYKGYNIAIHELGHNVEQTLTLYDVNYYMLNGVPNTAFTEALAFVFQKRDLELLNITQENPHKMELMALDNFWSCYEIMGVSLVDMRVWKWLYENPEATPTELKQAVTDIAKDVWNSYYAEIFGVKDQPILAIYSHMIDYPLYLSAYPIGHLIDFQIEKQIEGKNFAEEIQRIYLQGRLIPQVWMQGAVGEKLSNQPMFDATEEALQVVGA